MNPVRGFRDRNSAHYALGFGGSSTIVSDNFDLKIDQTVSNSTVISSPNFYMRPTIS